MKRRGMLAIWSVLALVACEKEENSTIATAEEKAIVYSYDGQFYRSTNPEEMAELTGKTADNQDVFEVEGLEDDVVYLFNSEAAYVEGLVDAFPAQENEIRMTRQYQHWLAEHPSATQQQKDRALTDLRVQWQTPLLKDNCVMNQPANVVYMYEHTNYGGADFGDVCQINWNSEVGSLNNINGSDFKNWNDKISSFQLSSDCGSIAELWIYEHSNFGGRKKCYLYNGAGTLQKNLTTEKFKWWKSAKKENWNDKISSYKLMRAS